VADQRALDAITRIERALARIDAAATRPAPVDRSEEQHLRAAHHALRERVSGALTQLDSLIQAGERR
jgi:hypothetical protein